MEKIDINILEKIVFETHEGFCKFVDSVEAEKTYQLPEGFWYESVRIDHTKYDMRSDERNTAGCCRQTSRCHATCGLHSLCAAPTMLRRSRLRRA